MSDYRCATASRARGESVAGSASTYRTFLLLEEPGPWGQDAWRDARLPEGLGAEVKRRCGPLSVRPLLIRAQHRRRPRGRRLFLAHAEGPDHHRLLSASVTDPREVLDLDLAAFLAGDDLGLSPAERSIYAVCTHGRHDACCAERGRPVLASVAAITPDQAWGVSHIGGDRFAGNLLVLGEGLYFGGLDADSAARAVLAHRDGHLDLEHLRGRSCWPMPVQAAEIELRRALEHTRLDGIRLVHRRAEGDLRIVDLEADGAPHTVILRRREAEPVLLTCHARRAEPPVGWEVVSITS
jgi:hypothetical protein